MNAEFASTIVNAISEQLRGFKEYCTQGNTLILTKLNAIEKDIKIIKEHIEKSSGEKTQNSEHVRIFSLPTTKDAMSANEEVLSECKTSHDNAFDEHFRHLKDERDKAFSDLDMYFDTAVGVKSGGKEMTSFTLSSNVLKDVECRLYVKSEDDGKPTEVGQVLCSLTVVTGGKILEIDDKGNSSKYKVRLNNKYMNEVSKKDGKKYIAIIFSEKSFDHIDGSRLKEFYLKFADKESGTDFYEKIKKQE
uniref:FH2 domain-containing protein n=1 Tax=Strongyloides papillosus TaxID=174720 RepID=A0A0N5CDB5_STREA